MIIKIRNFIIGLRFKKYGHVKTRFDAYFVSYKLLKAVGQLSALLIVAIGVVQFAAIAQQPVKTNEEKINKAFAMAQSIINMNVAIMKSLTI